MAYDEVYTIICSFGIIEHERVGVFPNGATDYSFDEGFLFERCAMGDRAPDYFCFHV